MTKVCIVGLGPAGIGAALTLSSDANIDLICLEAGNPPNERVCARHSKRDCDKEKHCQIICGFGGCAFLSGGKISDFPAGEGLASVHGSSEEYKKALHYALQELSEYIQLEKPIVEEKSIEKERNYFSNLGFKYKYYNSYLCQHEQIAAGLQKIYQKLKLNGVSILFRTRLISIERNGKGLELTIEKGTEFSTINADILILAVGRSGKTLLKQLNECQNLNGTQNSIDIGVRLEFPTELFDIVKVHKDLKLLFKNARTFCVCKDGKVIEYFSNDMLLTEGCCNANKTGFTNLGITVRLPNSSENVKLLETIKERLSFLNNGQIICQRLDSYLANNPSSKQSDSQEVKIDSALPERIKSEVLEAVYYFSSRFFLKERWHEVMVYAPEIDFGGISIPIGRDFSITPNIYLVGDCTGRFRGILQAWSSGRSAAKNIIGEKDENSK